MPNANATVVRGVRGATTLAETEDERAEVMDATEELLRAMIATNDIDSEDIAAVYFTVTSDIHSEFPAVAARERLGWNLVPLINSVEIDVTGAMPKCIRVLVFLNTDKSQADIKHVYLRDAVKLRSDIADAQ